jgi:hypothetical protein
MCSYSRNRRRISRWGCEQENQGSEIDAAYLSSGCGTVAVHEAGRPPGIHFIIYILPAN